MANNFALIDWVIVVIYLIGSLLIGVYANKFIHSTRAYLIGGGRSGTSLNVATYIGTRTVVRTTTREYRKTPASVYARHELLPCTSCWSRRA